LFFADTPLGPWRAHPNNPVRCLKHRMRPAGLPFVLAGALVRPAQDCTSTYGGRIELHRVTTLSTTDYAEEPAGALEPCRQWPYAAGMHTVSMARGMVIFDAKRKQMARADFRKVLRRKVRAVVSR
jgi:hypothetical protein